MNEKYYCDKFIESLIYDINLEERLKTRELDEKFNKDFLKNLNDYLEINQKSHFLDKKIKGKIYELINYIRFSISQTEETIRIINEIIVKTNRIENLMSLNFYCNEANKRVYVASDANISFDDKIEQIFSMIDKINKSISYDYQVLCDITKRPEEYKKIFTKYIANVWFLCSVKAMYSENKMIFEDLLVRENIGKVITENEHIMNQKELLERNNEIKIKILRR